MLSRLKTSLVAFCAMFLFTLHSLHAELAPVPALKSHVTDLTQTLTIEQQSQLEAKLATFEQQKGSQIAVLIIATTQPEAIEQYGIRVVDHWKLGREKQDDGVLLLVAKSDRKIRIEVGRGLEGAIPDIYAKRIISEVISPRFKQGDFSGGINAGVDKLTALIDDEALPPPQKQPANFDGFLQSWPLVFFGVIALGIFLRSVFGDFVGSGLNGAVFGGVALLLGVTLGAALLIVFVIFIISLMMGLSGNGHGGNYGSGYSGGSYSSGSSWGGGGGTFSGGGASGDW